MKLGLLSKCLLKVHFWPFCMQILSDRDSLQISVCAPRRWWSRIGSSPRTTQVRERRVKISMVSAMIQLNRFCEGPREQVPNSGLLSFSCEVVSDCFVTPWTAAHRASLSFTISQSLLKLMSIESVMPSSHLIPCYLLLLLPSMFPRIRVFSSELALCIRWPKKQNFNFSISTSSKYLWLISFRIDWFDLLAVQGTLKSLLQHHSSKTSILQRSAFFLVQLSHPYMTTRKTTALTRRTFVGKVNVSAF